MQNLNEEMKRIGGMIKGLFDTSLLGEKREMINDQFSEVSDTLETIMQDLGGQEKITALQGILEENIGANVPAFMNKERVEEVEVIPFKVIKNKIGLNYADIQARTTKIMVDKFGLSQKSNITVPAFAQTEGHYVEKSLYNELDQNFFHSEEKVAKLLKEVESLQSTIDEKVNIIESGVEREKISERNI